MDLAKNHVCYFVHFTDDKYIKIEDMMLLRKRIKLLNEERQRRNAVVDEELLWPNGVVPYVITSDFDGE